MNQLKFQIINGESAQELAKFPDNHFDSVVCDPPYMIGFLGKDWDHKDVSLQPVFEQCFRVLKPGGYILAFSAARTYHHLALAIERSGFEIRDQIMWVYGSGFPKSQDIGKQIAKNGGTNTDWDGWGNALKPAHEPIVMAQKPFKGPLYKHVQEWNVGGLNIDACRVEHQEEFPDNLPSRAWANLDGENYQESGHDHNSGTNKEAIQKLQQLGRFPANFIHDGSDEVVQMFPDDTQRFFYCAKVSKAERHIGMNNNLKGNVWELEDQNQLVEQSSQLQKATSEDTMQSLKNIEWNTTLFGSNITEQSQQDIKFITSTVSKLITELKTLNASAHWNTNENIVDAIKMLTDNGKNHVENVELLNQLIQNTTNESQASALGVVLAVLKTLLLIKPSENSLLVNNHPTLKPVALMRYLIKLVTPPNSRVLDPFNGSGSTGMAAVELGHEYVGIELDPNYVEIANKRIQAWYEHTKPKSTFNELFTEEK